LERAGLVRRPIVPQDCEDNAHLYYLLLPDLERRAALIEGLRATGIQAPFHYVPLHGSPAGRRFGRAHGSLAVTDAAADRLIRLPLWYGIGAAQDRVIAAVHRLLR
jgi:dTDP-4-amino-4,6-dideoxygalactose transaminase